MLHTPQRSSIVNPAIQLDPVKGKGTADLPPHITASAFYLHQNTSIKRVRPGAGFNQTYALPLMFLGIKASGREVDHSQRLL